MCSIGLKNGLERVTKVMMLALLAIMVLLAINSFFVPGGEKGLAFYLMPDIDEVNEAGIGSIIVNAMNQCSDPHDRVCVNEKIRATKDFQGVTGTLTLQNGDAIRSAVINEVKDGKLAFRTVVNP